MPFRIWVYPGYHPQNEGKCSTGFSEASYVDKKDADNENIYETIPIMYNISNGPQNLAANLMQLPNFNELLFGFTFRNTCSPTWNSLATLPLST
jgi:hypothetical protein